jgi:hypothetical protein
LNAPIFKPSQQKRLRLQYFAATGREGQLRFAETCLTFARRGYQLQDFFEQEGLVDEYQEMLDEAMLAYVASKSGYLYLAVNPIYASGLYKVGATRKTPADRMRSLTTAGIPGQFTLVKSWQVPDAFAAEAHCALTLAQRRIQREFYEGTFPELTSAIDGVVAEEWSLFHKVSQAIELPLTS